MAIFYLGKLVIKMHATNLLGLRTDESDCIQEGIKDL